MENSLLVGIIGAAVGIIGLFFAIYLAIKTKQLKSPKISINPGYNVFTQEISDTSNPGSRDDLLKYMKQKPFIEGIIYGVSRGVLNKNIVYCPYSIFNTSDVSIRNVDFRLEYSSRFFFDENNELNRPFLKDQTLYNDKYSKNDNYGRESYSIGGTTHVSFKIDLIRPKEGIVLFDVLCLSSESLDNIMTDKKDEKYSPLRKLLKRHEKFQDFTIIDYFVFSENNKPLINKLKLTWFDSTSLDELISLVNEYVSAFFGGENPKSGHYYPTKFIYFKKGFRKKEYAEIVVPELNSFSSEEDGNVLLQANPGVIPDGATITYFLPSWNYLQNKIGLTVDELIQEKTGYKRIQINI